MNLHLREKKCFNFSYFSLNLTIFLNNNLTGKKRDIIYDDN